MIDLAAGDGVLLDEGCLGGWTSSDAALGLEIDPEVVCGRSADGARIESGDGLLDAEALLRGWQADVVVGNPPFGRSRDLLTDVQRHRLETEPTAPRGIWGPKALDAAGCFTGSAGNCRVEQLFLERALSLLGDDGLAAYILSDGVLSNRREQVARDWLDEKARLLAAAILDAADCADEHLVAVRSRHAAEQETN